MASRKLQLFLVYLLVLHLAALALITFIVYVASSTKSNCNLSITGIVTASKCTIFERISSFIYNRQSYIQSIHTHVCQNIVTLALFVFTPSVLGMVWSGLMGGTLTVKNFRRNIDLVNS